MLASSMLASTGRTVFSKSSYWVPNSATAVWFFSTGSFIASSALTTSKNAFCAVSPPLANACIVVLAFRPSVANALVVDLEPSFARMLNSLTASPTLSIENTPASAPAIRPLTNWSADSPNAAYWVEYSFRVSSKSPFWSAPFCAPVAMMLYALLASMPKFFMSADAVLALSLNSYPKVSRRANPASVAACSSSPISWVFCRTTEMPSATSSRESPKLWLYTFWAICPSCSSSFPVVPVAALI